MASLVYVSRATASRSRAMQSMLRPIVILAVALGRAAAVDQLLRGAADLNLRGSSQLYSQVRGRERVRLPVFKRQGVAHNPYDIFANDTVPDPHAWEFPEASSFVVPGP